MLQQPLCLFAVGSGSLLEPALLLPKASSPLPLLPTHLPHPLLCPLKLFNLQLKFPPQLPNLVSKQPKLLYHPLPNLVPHPKRESTWKSFFLKAT